MVLHRFDLSLSRIDPCGTRGLSPLLGTASQRIGITHSTQTSQSQVRSAIPSAKNKEAGHSPASFALTRRL
jgi:hypothetical protein